MEALRQDEQDAKNEFRKWIYVGVMPQLNLEEQDTFDFKCANNILESYEMSTIFEQPVL